MEKNKGNLRREYTDKIVSFKLPFRIVCGSLIVAFESRLIRSLISLIIIKEV